MQPLGPHCQPMQTHESEALRDDDVPYLPSAVGRQLGCILHEGERCDLDAIPARPLDGAACFRKFGLAVQLIANGELESEILSHQTTLQQPFRPSRFTDSALQQGPD